MRNESIASALAYHDRTKHRPLRYAASLGYMDWTTQPDPFRRYRGASVIPLPFSEVSPPYHLLFAPESLPAAPLCIESIAHLLRFSLGVAAWKSHGGSSWALRCNASSGNLHPTECYLIAPAFDNLSRHMTLAHYAPKEHALEILQEYDPSPSDSFEEGSIIVVLTSVLWREAWKYGERSWRYCQLDAGHAYEAIRVSAKTLGWECSLLPSDTADFAKTLGLDAPERFHPLERESVDMAILIRPSQKGSALSPLPLPSAPPALAASRLSPSHHEWPVLEIIDKSTQGIYPQVEPLTSHRHIPPPTQNAHKIILKRRSAQMMDGSSITYTAFRQILDASLDLADTPDVHFILFVHRVSGLEPGLYAYVRNEKDTVGLQRHMRGDFVWKEHGDGLYLLQEGDFRGNAQRISCNQEIAKEGAFSFGMLCRFSEPIETDGAVRYKNLFHQCGAIGQLLYLESTSLGLSATGIGCFLDDEFHRLLGLENERYQSLYHFTIGRAIVDTRITTLPPY